eukprot:scaffold2982_cov154-Isochrysis_galbana.AAC.4
MMHRATTQSTTRNFRDPYAKHYGSNGFRAIPAAAAASVGCGTSFRLTALTRTRLLSATCNSNAATFKPTSPDAHAASMLVHGPCIPSAKEMRPHATEMVSEVAV